MSGHMNRVDGEQRSSRRKSAARRKKKILIAAAAISVIMVSLALALSANWDKWFGDEEVVLPPIDPQAVEWTGDLPYDSGEKGSDEISVPGYKSMTVAANSKNVEVSWVNPSSNDCYFVFRLALVEGDRQEVLYESDLVEPGKGFYDIELTRELKPGLYQAQLQYDAYDLKTKASLNGAVLDFELYAN